MRVLIPAYEPDERLVALVASLSQHADVLVVDDGSGPAHLDVFEAAADHGATVIRHDRNLGKAAALRTGFRWVLEHDPDADTVCADADGQHRAADVLRVGTVLAKRRASHLPDAVVLGARAFDGDVPWRSRVGNRATSALVTAVARGWISDTQTGLRGLPASLLPWALTVRGERFAYELRLLLAAARRGVPLIEEPIATVYLDGNASSHFRPVRDSLQVLAPLAAFAASSLVAFGLDTALLVALHAYGLSLGVSLVFARSVSGLVNFAFNRRAVFRAEGRGLPQLARYVALALGLLAAGYGMLTVLTSAGLPLLAAKLITDGALWLASFGIQRRVVFRTSPRMPKARGAGKVRSHA